MYASIRHWARGAVSGDDLEQAERALATRLSKALGFVAYVLVETPNGHAAVCLFEDRASLVAGEASIVGEAPAGSPALVADAASPMIGEVVVHKGL